MEAVKAIICYAARAGYAAGTVHVTSFTRDWTPCQCGNVRAKWLDERAGTMVADAADREKVRFLGMDNRMLIPRMSGIGGDAWEVHRTLHEISTTAPGYVFDKSRAGCWAVIARIGSTGDTRWATPEESAEARAEASP